eukprot:scaffold21073_cov32-Prasinocladus_malaysianus.AAC.2
MGFAREDWTGGQNLKSSQSMLLTCHQVRLADIPCADAAAQAAANAEPKNVRLMRRTPSAENASSSGSLSQQALDDESLARYETQTLAVCKHQYCFKQYEPDM